MNPLSVNPTKWSTQSHNSHNSSAFVDELFGVDHFVRLALKWLQNVKIKNFFIIRSCRSQTFYKETLLQNFKKFKAKYLYQSLFVNKVKG